MAFWANLIGYQATWCVVAWSAGQGRAWLGMLACTVFIATQWRASPVRRADARVLLAALGCGVLVEGVAAGSGLLAYAAPQPALPAPAWIVLLWGAFAMTLNHSMAWFAAHPWIAAIFAAGASLSAISIRPRPSSSRSRCSSTPGSIPRATCRRCA